MSEQTNKNIVIVTYHYSIVVRGIEKNLKDAGYEVLTVREDSEELDEYAKKAAVFLIYLSEDILANGEGILSLEGIQGILDDLGKKMIIIGEKKSHEDFIKAIPALEKHVWMDRPIDREGLLQTIGKMSSSSGKKNGTGKILIVDDDPSYARIIREWLKDIYKVSVMTTGKLVMNFLGKNDVDLILLDYEMPDMDGTEVFQMLQGNPTTADIPVVFLTGVNTKEQITQVMSLKPAGYVLKGMSKEDLIHKIAELI